MAILCRSILEFLRIDFWLTFKNSLLLAAFYFLIIPVIRGISNLDTIQSAQCLGQSAALIGVIIIVPISSMEQKTGIKEIIYTKAWSYMKSIIIRLISSFLLVICFITGFAFIMQVNHCIFPFGEFVFAAVLYTEFLGLLGLVLSQLDGNVVIGYFMSLGYWSLCQFQIFLERDGFYLFPVVNGNIEMQKLIILFLVVVILTGSVLFTVRRKTGIF
ncbi:MAG: hypothetical protein K2N61_00740 [Lachnospiraceae bacterium]|nr:hypothetical protein [Lachnospiraceae bacterium]